MKYTGSKLWSALPVDLKNVYSKVLVKQKKLKERLVQSLE